MRTNIVFGISSVVCLLVVVAIYLFTTGNQLKDEEAIQQIKPHIAICSPFPECFEFPIKSDVAEANEIFQLIDQTSQSNHKLKIKKQKS